QQRVAGVELVGVVAAERVQVVNDQKHLAEPVVEPGGAAVAAGTAEGLALLTGQQELFEFAEGATDLLRLQGGGDTADVAEILEVAQLTAAVVQAVEADL